MNGHSGTNKKPSKAAQKIATQSYRSLADAIKQIRSKEAEVEIGEAGEKFKVPLRALKLLSDILKAMSEGHPVSVVPVATEVTTQKAAEILGCSRPYLVKVLEEGKIAYTKVGRHRRLRYEDVIRYKQQTMQQQKQNIIEIMNYDEEIGLYDR